MSLSYCYRGMNMHNMHMAKAAMLTMFAFPVQILYNPSLNSLKHICLFVFKVSVSWGQYCPHLSHLTVKKVHFSQVHFVLLCSFI